MKALINPSLTRRQLNEPVTILPGTQQLVDGSNSLDSDPWWVQESKNSLQSPWITLKVDTVGLACGRVSDLQLFSNVDASTPCSGLDASPGLERLSHGLDAELIQEDLPTCPQGSIEVRGRASILRLRLCRP